MGAKKKKGGKKKGGGKDLLKKLMETPEELIIKENLTERIVIERLGISLDELEEENNELFTTFKQNIADYKE